MPAKKERSRFSEAELYEALLAFTDPKSPQFDPVFTEEIMRVAPHWRGLKICRRKKLPPKLLPTSKS